MRTIKILFLLIFLGFGTTAFAQEMPSPVINALKADNADALKSLINKDNINTCYGNYSLLSVAIREGAKKCFDLLISEGADVNKSCNGYVPPLMHAVKYGQLDMVKVLIEKGADIHYKYAGSLKLTNGPQAGDTPFTYAEKYERDDIADYLGSLKK